MKWTIHMFALQLLGFLIAIHMSDTSMWHCVVSVMVYQALSLVDFAMHSAMCLLFFLNKVIQFRGERF
jgi:hypothetical protein